MKAIIKNVTFSKEFDGKFGPMFSHKIEYDIDGQPRFAFYTSKAKEQTTFKTGVEAEFTEEKRTSDRGEFYIIKPVAPAGTSNYGRAIKQERSRYSAFAVSYSKDLVVADRIPISEMKTVATELFHLMVALDKTLDV